MKKQTRTATLLLLIVVLGCIFEDVSAGRRGGSSRSRSRTTLSKSRSKSSGSYRGSYRPSVSRWWTPGLSVRYVGMYYGLSWWYRSPRYRRYPNWEPEVCSGRRVGISENGTTITYQFFICPGQKDSEKATYCCGSHNAQRCCTYWEDSGRAAGAIIGIIIGVLVLACCIGFGIYYCRKASRNSTARRPGNNEDNAAKTAMINVNDKGHSPPPGYSDTAIPPPLTNNPYPPQPYGSNPPMPPPVPPSMPDSYINGGGYGQPAYPPMPGGAAPPLPPSAASYPPVGQPPYPPGPGAPPYPPMPQADVNMTAPPPYPPSSGAI